MLKEDSTDPYNQAFLRKKHKIDSIIKRDTYGNVTYILIGPSGKMKQSTEYDSDGVVVEKTKYDNNENVIRNESVFIEQNGKDIIKETIKSSYTYSLNHLMRHEISSSSTGKHIEKYFYDAKWRLLKHGYYFFDILDYVDSYSYEDNYLKAKMIRTDSDKKYILDEVITYDSLARKMESKAYRNGVLEAVMKYEYDIFGNEKRAANYWDGGINLNTEKLNYYSSKSRIDSSKYRNKTSEGWQENKHYYEYDSRGLLIRETSVSSDDTLKRVSTYTYK